MRTTSRRTLRLGIVIVAALAAAVVPRAARAEADAFGVGDGHRGSKTVARDGAELLPESDGILGEVRKVLDDHKELTLVRVEGHTDNVGKADYNRKLSQRRAESVKAWLVKKGIDAKRLKAQGFGPDEPIDSNDTDVGRANNRRVAFTILKREDAAAPAKP